MDFFLGQVCSWESGRIQELSHEWFCFLLIGTKTDFTSQDSKTAKLEETCFKRFISFNRVTKSVSSMASI